MPEWNKECSEWELTSGDEVWYVPGYGGNYLIAIKCKITEVSTYFRDKHPRGRLFYWIDEPVGHTLGADKLFLDREDALSELELRVEDLKSFLVDEYHPEQLIERESDLQAYREQCLNSIRESWVRAGAEEEWTDTKYPDKESNDWVSAIYVEPKPRTS